MRSSKVTPINFQSAPRVRTHALAQSPEQRWNATPKTKAKGEARG